MNALDILQRDHRKVEDMISSLNATLRNDTHSRKTLVQQLREELKMHEQLEEELFYPALMEHSETRDLAQHSYREHQDVDTIISALADLDSHLDEWKTKLAELQANLFHHIHEEEKELFVKAKKVLSLEDLEDMGMEMAEMKDQVLA